MSGAVGSQLREAQHINRSLSLLGSCISALRANGKIRNRNPAATGVDERHVPFRDCKLTFVLSDSLGGDSKTLLLLHCSPTQVHAHESACTLAFGVRARGVSLGPATRQIAGAPKGPYGATTPVPRSAGGGGSPPANAARAARPHAASDQALEDAAARLRDNEERLARLREESERTYAAVSYS